MLLSCLVVFTITAQYTIKTIPNPKTTNAANFVSNPDNIINSQTVSQINQLLSELQNTNKSEVAVVIVNSIGFEEIKPFSTKLFKHWGIGTAENSNGLLVLFVLDQRKVTFETGYGLEGILPDATTKRIQTRYMIPEFKAGNYDAGIYAGVEQIVKTVKEERFVEKNNKILWAEILPMAIGVYLFLMLLSFVWISNIITKVRKNTKLSSNIVRYKAIKTQKAGALMVLAIMLPVVAVVAILLLQLPMYYLLLVIPVPFTTLPAKIYGGIMMYKVRREPIACNECGGQMKLLSEKKEDAHLKMAQQFEEQLNAVDYDVFLCDSCKNETIFTYDKPSEYTNCPRCSTKAFILKEKRTIVAPTYISGGTERTTFHCKFCGYEEHHNDNLPRLQRNGDSMVAGAVIGSILSSGRGGFGGGGGGFSGGSFGGGFSGGGGSTSGW